jgi:phenylalanyl-tRNA synthetase alpha chain
LSSVLHPIERKIISVLEHGKEMNLETIVVSTGLQVDQVRRALEWLSSKGLVELKTDLVEVYSSTGKVPAELVLVDVLKSKGGSIPLSNIRQHFDSDGSASAAIGKAKRAGWISLDSAGGIESVHLVGEAGAKDLQNLLDRTKVSVERSALTDQERLNADDLVRRGILSVQRDKGLKAMITNVGEKVVLTSAAEHGGVAGSTPGEAELIDKLTPEILASGAWKGKRLRAIDVEAKAPRFFPGRRHPVRDFIREVRETYISMGFKELQGGSVHPAFWNFDALFIPQDHPGREMQDTFYLEGFTDKKLERRGVVSNVASTHENGWKTGSKGWGYKWRIEEARKLVLRTHNTVLSVRALSEFKEEETRVFAVSKVYRNENLDFKHLAEFYQMDGIIVGRGLNVRHLMGFLKEFYKKLGMDDVKLWPTYFPYTEPSLEVVGYSKGAKGWIELSGSGVFRPEVTLPLGVRVPVLAWGPGIERLMLMRFGLDDMRELYGNDLSWLRRRVELASSQN